MNNKPYGWVKNGEYVLYIEKPDNVFNYTPLYTHPVKEQKCIVKDCENHKHEGSFNGDLCSPCYQFIAHGKGIYSQAYRNTHPVKELTDKEIEECYWGDGYPNNPRHPKEFARAILRKAQEK